MKMGVVSEEQLKKALDIQAKSKAKGVKIMLGQALTQLGYCKEEDIAKAMAKKWGLDFMSINNTGVDMAAANLVTPEVALKYKLIPVRISDGKLIVAMNNPNDIIAIDDIELLTGYEVQPVVVVDRNPERVERAIAAGLLAVNADSTRDEVLRDVGVTRARGMVSALATDADNLFVLLSAKALNPAIYVVTRAAEEGVEEKMRRAGADAVFAPYAMTGHRLAQSLLRPHVVQFLDFATGIDLAIAMEQVRVADESEAVGKTIAELQIRRQLGVVVLAVRKRNGEMIFNPPADTPVAGGDYLIVMGKQTDLQALETLLAGSRQVRR
jgi:Trk K+ transport system NAD-binding subunit